MLFITFLLFLVFGKTVHSQTWNTTGDILPWESYLQLGDIQRPLGLTLNRSSIAHRHFYIGYLCLHSFMYDEAQEAFDLAISINNTFIEPYIGKMLGYKQALWNYTYPVLGQTVYNRTQLMMSTSNKTFSNLQLLLLETVYQWYAYGLVNTTDGERAFLTKIANLSQTYPNETDISVLWGLSLLNVADQIQYQSIMEPEKMIESRVVLKRALVNEPSHPGALHYLIHAYDVVQVNISEQAERYAIEYGDMTKTSSHAQHMPSHIWMRTGLWSRALSADGTGIIASFTLCAIKLLNRTVSSISSTQLETVLNLFNTTNQTSSFLSCDAENRAHSTEWLSYSRLQTGNWSGSVALLRDLFTSGSKSALLSDHYLPFAYRTQARTIIELFFWFPYDYQFLSKTQQLLSLNGTNPLVLMGNNTSRWYPIWSEAGLRFSECLRLLTIANTSNITSEINGHLSRLAVLSSRSLPLNQYASKSISMMIPQINGIRHYVNQSWQDCLNELNNAARSEEELVADSNSPTLIFARSSELLAMHLLLIHAKVKGQSGKSLSSSYTLNGSNVSISEFPAKALNFYRKSNSTASNRAINTLGIARSNLQQGNETEAKKYFQILLTQMNSSTDSDPIFLQEALTITTTTNTTTTTITTTTYNSATINRQFFLVFICILSIFS